MHRKQVRICPNINFNKKFAQKFRGFSESLIQFLHQNRVSTEHNTI